MSYSDNRQTLYKHTASQNQNKYSRKAMYEKMRSKVTERNSVTGTTVEKDVEEEVIFNPALTRHEKVHRIFPDHNTYYSARTGAGNDGPVITNMGELLRRIRLGKLQATTVDADGNVSIGNLSLDNTIKNQVPNKGFWGENRTKDDNGNPTSWATKSMYSAYYNNVTERKTTYWWVLNDLGKKISERFSYTMDTDRYGTIMNMEPSAVNYRWATGRSIILNMHFDGYLNDNKTNLKLNFNPFKNLFFNMGLGLGESPVINPPFQWNERDDPRTHARYTKIGRVYASRIYSNYPMLMIMPGEIKYNNNILKMIGFDGGNSRKTVNYIRGKGTGLKDFIHFVGGGLFQGVGDILSVVMLGVSMLFGSSRLIEFRQRYNLYAGYLAGLSKDLAVALGLVNNKGQYIGKWANLHPTMMLPGRLLGKTQGKGGVLFGFTMDKNALLRSNQMISYVVGKDVGISETFSNSTRSNPLMEQMQAASQEQAADNANGNIGMIGQGINSIMGLLGGNKQAAGTFALNFGQRLGSRVSETAVITSGLARPTMPDVWEASSFSRSYNVSFRFHSPYGDKLSIYENVYYPFLSLLAMVLPRQVGSMSYMDPFAIRATMPGMFNINYGIIETLTVKRGEDQNDWTVDNIPKTMSVDVTFKDFEPQMLMPLGSRTLGKSLQESIFQASGISEYITTLSGMTLSEQLDMGKRIQRGMTRWRSGWMDILNKDIGEMWIYNANPLSNLLGKFRLFSHDTIRQDEIDEEQYNVFVANASRLSQSKNSDSYLAGSVEAAGNAAKSVVSFGNTFVNWALDKVRVKKSGKDEFDVEYVGSDEVFQSDEEKNDTEINMD